MSDINDLVLYQEEIFDIYNKWKALQSSYTTSSEEAGRPKADDSNMNESTTKSRENDDNNKK